MKVSGIWCAEYPWKWAWGREQVTWPDSEDKGPCGESGWMTAGESGYSGVGGLGAPQRQVEKVDRKRQDRIQTSDRGWDLLWWQQGAMGSTEQGAGLALTTSSANPPSIALVPVASRQGSKNACVESAYLKVSIKKEKKNHKTVYVVWS